MATIKTSSTDPMRIDKIDLPGGQGYIGMTLCPGKKIRSTFGYIWDRDLGEDLQCLTDEKADGVLTIMEAEELESCKVPDLGAELRKAGLRWWHLSVIDTYVLGPNRYHEWETLRRELAAFVLSGKNLVVHCRGGLGRTGTLAAVFLADLLDIPTREAIGIVREARPGTVENRHQEDFVLNYRDLGPDDYFRPIFSDSDGKVAGCLLGGAIGDAFGYAVEFESLAGIRRQFGKDGIRDLELTGDKALISDDTQMTLFTLQGLLNAMEGGGKPVHEKIRTEIYNSYLAWLETQGEANGAPWNYLLSVQELFSRRAPGNTCLSALKSGKSGTIDRPINNSHGCGGVMRVAPVGLIKAFSPVEAFMIGADSAALTHGHPSGYWSAAALAMVIRLLMDGKDLHHAVEKSLTELQKHPSADETRLAVTEALELAGSGRPATGETVEQLGGGWVGEEALAIGLYAALKGKDFRDAISISANHSGDSDSTASITGQLLGALHGLACIPEEWKQQVELSGVIHDLSNRLDKINQISGKQAET